MPAVPFDENELPPVNPQSPAGPTFSETLGASMRQENMVVSIFSRLHQGSFPPVDGYNPWEDIKDNELYKAHAPAFSSSTSPEQSHAIMRRIDQQEADRATLAASGNMGVVAGIISSIDPTWALPGRVAVGAYKLGGALRGAAEVGVAGGLQAGVQQAGLYASQPDRSAKESLVSVGSATILGALLGGGLGHLSRGEHAAIVDKMDSERAATKAHVSGAPVAEPAMGAAPTGAAAADTRTLEDLTPVSAFGLEKLGDNIVTRTLLKGSLAARRLATELSEVAVLVKGNIPKQVLDTEMVLDAKGEPLLDAKGKPVVKVTPRVDAEGRPVMTVKTTTAGGMAPIETIARTQQIDVANKVQDALVDAWKETNFGAAANAPWFAKTRDELSAFGLPSPARVTFEDFSKQVGDAVMFEKPSDNPHIQKVAEQIKPIFDEWAARAEKSVQGFKRAEVVPGENYFPHVWNKFMIRARRPEFVDKLVEKYSGDQAANAATQERIRSHQGGLDQHEANIKKYTGQLEQKQARLAEEEAKAEEVQRFNRFAFKRSEDLTEASDEARARITKIQSEIQPHLDRLEKLGEDIKAEKENFPEIKEADALIFKMIGAAQKLKQSKDLIDAVDAATEYTEELDKVISGFKGGIREATDQAKMARRDLGADRLVELEKSRTELKKEIKPYLKALKSARDEIAAEKATKGPLARGGAVFETQIRERGNTLADRLSGRRHEIADLEEKLQAEHASAAAVRGRIEEEIANWHGQSTAEAKSAIKAREKYEVEREAKRAAKGGEEPKGGRVRSADEAVDRAVEAILKSDTDRPLDELRRTAHQTTERILGSPDGRLPYDESAVGGMPKFVGQPPMRGSLAERALDVSNAWAKDAGGNESWIERDITKVMKNYMRTFAPDVLLSERFGDVEMKAQLRLIEEDYEKLTDAARGNTKELKRLDNERKAAIRDVAILRDRLRGLFQIPKDDTERNIGRIAAAMRNFSTVTSMGMAAISSIPDTANVIARWGLNSVFNDAWSPFLTSLMTADRKYAKEVIRQFQVMKIVHETQSAMRHHDLNGITEPYAQGSPVERFLQYGADKMQLLNLMGPQTDLLKAIAATVASTGIYRAAKRATAGKATKTDLLQLGQANIRQDLYEHIVAQYEKSGTEIDGHMLPNTEAWEHPEAKAAFEAAVQRDVNLSVVTPGIDKPATLSHPVLAVLTQFKQFTAAATTRILVANLQRADGHTLQGLIASLGFGAMAYYVHSVATGQPTSANPSDWIKEAVSRGNLLGWLDEANTLTSKMSRGKVDMYRAVGANKPLTRDAGRTAVENLLGPSFGKMANLTRVTGAMATGEVNAGDLHAVRRLGPYQNLWFLNRALTEVEKSIGSSFGIKQPQPRH